jgi:hypothetical protein
MSAVRSTHEKMDAYTISAEKPQGKRPLCMWEDNIKLNLR